MHAVSYSLVCIHSDSRFLAWVRETPMVKEDFLWSRWTGPEGLIRGCRFVATFPILFCESGAGADKAVILSAMGNGVDEVEDEGTDRRSTSSWLKIVTPWFIALALVAYLLWYVPLADVWNAIGEADVRWYVPVVLVSVFYWFLLDSLAYSYLISRFNAPLSWKEARGMRGVTYWVAALNWNAGTAAIILYLNRLKGIRPLASASSVLFYSMFDAMILMGLAFVGSTFLLQDTVMRTVQGVSALFVIGNAVFLTVLISDSPHWSWLGKIRGWSIFSSHRQARPVDFLILLAIRIAYLSGFVACFLIGARAFGIEVPLGLGLASIPVIMVAGALPISPAGLGTQAAAMLFFWAELGDSAAIVAYGLVFPVSLMLARVVLGVPYMLEFRRLTTPDD